MLKKKALTFATLFFGITGCIVQTVPQQQSTKEMPVYTEQETEDCSALGFPPSRMKYFDYALEKWNPRFTCTAILECVSTYREFGIDIVFEHPKEYKFSNVYNSQIYKSCTSEKLAELYNANSERYFSEVQGLLRKADLVQGDELLRRAVHVHTLVDKGEYESTNEFQARKVQKAKELIPSIMLIGSSYTVNNLRYDADSEIYKFIYNRLNLQPFNFKIARQTQRQGNVSYQSIIGVIDGSSSSSVSLSFDISDSYFELHTFKKGGLKVPISEAKKEKYELYLFFLVAINNYDITLDTEYTSATLSSPSSSMEKKYTIKADKVIPVIYSKSEDKFYTITMKSIKVPDNIKLSDFL